MSYINKLSRSSNVNPGINQDTSEVRLKNLELVELVNTIFGNRWSHSVTSTTIDFVDNDLGKCQVGCQATVKVQLSDERYHEDVGYSVVDAPTKGLALEKARLTAIFNAFKKTLSCFVEMENEMRRFLSTEITTDISQIVKTTFPPKRAKTPPPTAQSTPKSSKISSVIGGLSERKSPIQLENKTNGMKPPAGDENGIIEIIDMNDIFEENPDLKDELKNPPPNCQSAPMNEEEKRLERKRKQQEKQEEYKRKLMEKERKVRQQ